MRGKDTHNTNGMRLPMAAFSLMLCAAAAGVMLLAWLITGGKMDMATAKPGIWGVLYLSGMLGGFCIRTPRDDAIKARLLLSCTVFTLLLSAGLLLFEGKLEGLVPNAVAIIAGCLTPCVVKRKGNGKMHRRK